MRVRANVLRLARNYASYGRSRTLSMMFASSMLAAPAAARAQTVQEDPGHVAPPPAVQPMAPMSMQEMDRVMDMHDDPLLAMFKLDQLERAHGDEAYATSWEAEAWIGRDFDKLWLRTEGEREDGVTDARIEAFWDHAFAGFWDWQLGVRHDFASGPQEPLSAIDGSRATRASAHRDWAAFGVQGLAPYWFEIEATAYVGEQGRTALRLRAEYELLLTQRLILQPELEANVYGKSDPAHGVTDGLSDFEFGLRLRYEIRREFAPYVGVVWTRRFGDSDLMTRHAGSDTQLVAGLRVWF
jgi:copper resistance protein B